MKQGLVLFAHGSSDPQWARPFERIALSLYPGQFAGIMGRQRDPWFIEMSAYEPLAYGAYPTYEFDHQRRDYKPRRKT